MTPIAHPGEENGLALASVPLKAYLPFPGAVHLNQTVQFKKISLKNVKSEDSDVAKKVVPSTEPEAPFICLASAKLSFVGGKTSFHERVKSNSSPDKLPRQTR